MDIGATVLLTSGSRTTAEYAGPTPLHAVEYVSGRANQSKHFRFRVHLVADIAAAPQPTSLAAIRASFSVRPQRRFAGSFMNSAAGR